MPEQTCPLCGEVFVVEDRDDLQEVIRRDEVGGFWRVVISSNRLAHGCEITEPAH
jgi:hypothetical protein